MNSLARVSRQVAALLCLAFVPVLASGAETPTYSQESVLSEAERFFGGPTEGLARVVETVFADLGEPTGYIAGEELSGAIGIGARWGKGELTLKGGSPHTVYWTGPSVGFDVGGNASKVFVLVYGMTDPKDVFQRFGAIDGSFYFVGGVGANYHRAGEIGLAPIRIGVGFRAGANIGYLHYTRTRTWIPL